MALGLTQPLREVSIRNVPGGKSGRRLRLTSPQAVNRLFRECGSTASSSKIIKTD
jgi:hypothetical protein